MQSFFAALFVVLFPTAAESVQDQTIPATSEQVIVLDNAVASLIRNVRIPAQEPGVIESITVREGEMIEKGQVVVEMQKRIHEMQLEAAQHELEIAKKSSENDVDVRYAKESLALAQNELDRDLEANRDLPNSVPASEIERSRLEVSRASLSGEQAERDLEIAKVQQAQKQVDLELAQYRLDRRSIRSPISGMFVERMTQEGEWAETGQPILRVIDLDRLYVKVLMDDQQYDRDLLDKRVMFELPDPSGGTPQQFFGRVVFVSPEVITVRRSFFVWAEIENTNRAVRPGAKGQLSIYLD